MMKHDVFPDEMKTSQAYYIDSYMKTMITMMLNQRFSEMKQKADCPFTSAYCEDGSYMLSSTKDAFTLGASAKEGKDIEPLKLFIARHNVYVNMVSHQPNLNVQNKNTSHKLNLHTLIAIRQPITNMATNCAITS